jgi:hypothetical protein
MKGLLAGFAASLVISGTSGCTTIQGSKVNFGHGSSNDIKLQKDVNVGSGEPTASEKVPNLHSKVELSCEGVSGSSERRVLMGKIGHNQKGLMNINSGVKEFGPRYPQPVRCEEIKTKIYRAISMGATGFNADVKNNKLVLCGAISDGKNAKCVLDKNGQVIEIATFKDGSSMDDIAVTFTASMKKDGKVSSGAGIVNNASNTYTDFVKTIMGE